MAEQQCRQARATRRDIDARQVGEANCTDRTGYKRISSEGRRVRTRQKADEAEYRVSLVHRAQSLQWESRSCTLTRGALPESHLERMVAVEENGPRGRPSARLHLPHTSTLPSLGNPSRAAPESTHQFWLLATGAGPAVICFLSRRSTTRKHTYHPNEFDVLRKRAS